MWRSKAVIRTRLCFCTCARVYLSLLLLTCRNTQSIMGISHNNRIPKRAVLVQTYWKECEMSSTLNWRLQLSCRYGNRAIPKNHSSRSCTLICISPPPLSSPLILYLEPKHDTIYLKILCMIIDAEARMWSTLWTGGDISRFVVFLHICWQYTASLLSVPSTGAHTRTCTLPSWNWGDYHQLFDS